MSRTQKIKKNLHSLIDEINNDELLEIALQLLNSKNISKEGDLLNKLSEEEKIELFLSYEESFDEANLLDFDQLKQNHLKWGEK